MNSSDFSPGKTLLIDQVSRRYFRRRWLLFVMICSVMFSPLPGLSSDNEAALWKELRSGNAFILLRHAIAPGMGDPAHFDVEDCSTQRNLSDRGRKQAVAIGNLFRTHGIEESRVFSSQWCRCLETAALLELGPVEELRHLNSFFQQYQRRDVQTENLRQWIGRQNLDKPLVLVTHQVNITALTGIYPSSGELVVARRTESGKITVLGTMTTD